MLALITPDRDRQCQRLPGDTICRVLGLGNKTFSNNIGLCNERKREENKLYKDCQIYKNLEFIHKKNMNQIFLTFKALQEHRNWLQQSREKLPFGQVFQETLKQFATVFAQSKTSKSPQKGVTTTRHHKYMSRDVLLGNISV